MVRVFANGPGDWCWIPGRVIPKTQKWYLMPPCLTLSTVRYRSRIKWSNPENGVASSSTLRCCSYWKESYLVAHYSGRQLIDIVYWKQTKYLTTLHFGLPSQVSFTIFPIVSIDSSFVWAIFPFCSVYPTPWWAPNLALQTSKAPPRVFLVLNNQIARLQ